jgi:hypothetical protein
MASYTCHSQQAVDKKRGAKLRIRSPRSHILKEKLLVDELFKWVIPGEIEGNQVGNKLLVIGDIGPWLGWDVEKGDIA